MYVAREVEFIRGSVTDPQVWEQALRGVDLIFHQAAYQDYMLDFSRFLEVNAVSTALLYETLVRRHIRPCKVIVASSQAVYGEGQYLCVGHGMILPNSRGHEQLRLRQWEVRCPECDQPLAPQLLDENHVNPVNQYAVSKLAGEKMALGLGRMHQIPTVALRYSITQGPRQSMFNQYSGILRIFSARAKTGKPLVIYEDGLQTRDFVHVLDVVDANFCVLENDLANYEAFNVGSGAPVTVLEYVEKLVQRMRRDVSCSIPGQYRLGDNRHSVSSVQKLRKLGWLPKRTLSTILDDFLQWFDEVTAQDLEVPDAYEEMCSSGVVRSTSA